MIRVSMISICACLVMASIGCSSGDDDDSGATPMAGATAAGSTAAGSTAAGTTATAGTTAGGAGMASPPANMPDATCVAMGNHMNPACENCGCTPNAMGGCLTELTACQGATDAMSAMLCGAIIDCATTNKCSGTDCVTPCMAQITPALSYMMGAPLTAATAVGTCTEEKCGSVCP